MFLDLNLINFEKFVKVGDQVLVVGELKTSNWKSKTTNEIWSKEVRVLKEKPDDDSEVPVNLSSIGTAVLEVELKNRKRMILLEEKSKHAKRLESGYYGEVSDDDGVITADDLYGEQF